MRLTMFYCNNQQQASLVIRAMRFTSCNGKVFTDSELKELLTKSIEEEKYEWAVIIRDELELRKVERARQPNG